MFPTIVSASAVGPMNPLAAMAAFVPQSAIRIVIVLPKCVSVVTASRRPNVR